MRMEGTTYINKMSYRVGLMDRPPNSSMSVMTRVGTTLWLRMVRNLNFIFLPSTLFLNQISSRSNRFHIVFWGR